MIRRVLLLAVALACSALAFGQGVMNDILTGSLIAPEEGVWAWYDLTDGATGGQFVMRLAIVKTEQVRKKTGYWLELEVVPMVGFKSIYKMLLTGPASDPANIHKVLQRSGADPVEEIPVPQKPAEDAASSKEPERKLLGVETVETIGGPVEAERYEVRGAEGAFEVWLSDKVPPMGVVRMKSADGDLKLRTFGKGGPEARSVIDDPIAPESDKLNFEPKVEVRVEEVPESRKKKTNSATETPVSGDTKKDPS